MKIADRMYIIVPAAQYNFHKLKTKDCLYWDYKKGMTPGLSILIFNPEINHIYLTKVGKMNIGTNVSEDGKTTTVKGLYEIKGPYPSNFVELKIVAETPLTKEVYSKFNLKQASSKLLKLNNPKIHNRLKLILDALPKSADITKTYIENIINGTSTKSGYTYFVAEIRHILGIERIKFLKIGYSRDKPDQNSGRVNGLKTANPVELRLLGYTNNADETSYHKRFEKYKANAGGGTEWFYYKGELKRFVQSL